MKTQKELWEQYKRLLKMAFPKIIFDHEAWNYSDAYGDNPYCNPKFMRIHQAYNRCAERLAAMEMTWSEAIERLLRGECLDGSRMSEGKVCFLRHEAWRLGYELQSSGIGDYLTYRFVKIEN